MNKELRKSLIEKYLNAETDVEQELMLAEWFATHDAGPEEVPVARLILAEYPEAGYDAAGREFDYIIASRKSRMRAVRWAYGFAACVAVAVGLALFFPHRQTCDFNGLEIAQGIERIMFLDMENVESVTARPKGNNVIITALLTDGSKCSYMMSKDGGTSAVSITAMND